MERVCALPGCGKSFTPIKSNQRFHHPQCAKKAEAIKKRQPRPEDRVCPLCNDTFTPTVANQIYCKPQHRRVAETERRTQKGKTHSITGAPMPTGLNIPTAKEGERIVIVGCIHYPFEDVRSLAAVDRFLKDFQPDVFVYAGDTLDSFELSKFSRSPLKKTTYGDDLRSTKVKLANRKRLIPNTRTLWIDGNHEYRLWLYQCNHAKALADIQDPPTLYGLRDLGIEYLPFGSHISYLSFQIEHGCFARKWSGYSARAERERHGTSGCSSHSHRRGMHSWTDERGTHTWYEMGTLSRLDPDWLAHPDWQAGFLYGTVHNNRLHVSNPAIYSDGFTAMGQFYRR